WVPPGINRFLENPSSMRNAAWVVVLATALAVFLGALVMWGLDHDEYPNYRRALWFTLQSVTTVGYGDVTPASAVGRAVAAIVMLVALGFITVVTATITSTFVEAARRRAATAAGTEDALEAILARLEAIEARLSERAGERPPEVDATREQR